MEGFRGIAACDSIVDLFLPQAARYLDFTHEAVFLEQEILPDLVLGNKHIVDLLARVKLKDDDILILFHIEAQAQYRANFAERMATYLLRLWLKHRQRICPVVVFSYDACHDEPGEYTMELPWGKYMWVGFHTIELKRLPWRSYLQHDNPVAAALLAKMGYEPADKVAVKMEFLRILTRLQLDPARKGLLSAFFDTYLKLNREEEEQLVSEIETKLQPSEAGKIREYTNSYIEMGREKGRAEGFSQGIMEGRAYGRIQLLLKQLKKRFGPLPADVEARLGALPDDKLDELGEALLGIENLAAFEELLKQPEPHR